MMMRRDCRNRLAKGEHQMPDRTSIRQFLRGLNNDLLSRWRHLGLVHGRQAPVPHDDDADEHDYS